MRNQIGLQDTPPTKLPLIQPSRATLVEVATFLKEKVPPASYLLACHPDTVAKHWQQIARACGFKYLNPHAWKHSYATIGAANLHKWYKGSVYLCFRTMFWTQNLAVS